MEAKGVSSALASVIAPNIVALSTANPTVKYSNPTLISPPILIMTRICDYGWVIGLLSMRRTRNYVAELRLRDAASVDQGGDRCSRPIRARAKTPYESCV